MDRLSAMHTFVRVTELGSFSAVAQQLGVASSVVTRQIAALERHLGVKLMARSTRRLALTSAGTSYLEKCRAILDLVQTAESGVAQERLTPRGTIRISLPLSYGLARMAPLLMDFSHQYAEIELDMDYSDHRVNLIEDNFDLSIRITHRLQDGEVARRLGSCRLQPLASPAYLKQHGTPLHPAELAQHQCLGYTAAGTQLWIFMVDGKPERFSVQSRFNANNGMVLTEAAARGLGITCQPDFIADPYLESGRVVGLLPDFPIPDLGVYAMLPGNRQVPHRVRVLMDYLTERLASGPQG